METMPKPHSRTLLKRPQLPVELPQTPFYLYDENILRSLADSFLKAIDNDPNIVLHYAIKANSQAAILKIFKEYGFGADVVSGEELKWVRKLGYSSNKIAYSGVGKSEEELKAAVEEEIALLIVESIEEYKELVEIAKLMPSKKLRIGMRFNPNLNIKTHPYIATGLWDHKFGMAREEVLALLKIQRPENLKIEALSLHLGSQIFEYGVFYDALEELLSLAKECGHRFPVLDVGGGLGVDYHNPYQAPDFEEYGKFLKTAKKKWAELHTGLDIQVYSECGRALVSQAGFLVTKLIRVKRNPKKNFAIVDASMTELLRPALYGAFHKIEKIPGQFDTATEVYDVVGPVCESGDFLAEKVSLPLLEKGDLLWVTCAGAYGFVMSSTYNMRALVAEYMLSNGALKCLRNSHRPWEIE